MTSPSGGENGSTSVSSVFGVAIFLGFLLLAAQVLIHLYATSTVTAIAFDNARRAAAEGGECPAAVARARSALGRWAEDPTRVVITCTAGSELTSLRIVGPSPALGLRVYGEVTGRATIDRGASVRTETF